MRSLVILLVIVSVGCSKESRVSSYTSPTDRLAQQVEQKRQSSSSYVDAYIPKAQGQIDGLNAPAIDILRQLPGVSEFQVLVKTPKASHRIIRLRDWHTVPHEQFALKIRQQVGRPVSDEEIEKLYRKHLLEVEFVQLEQIALLRCLVKHHGLKRILIEGLTPKSVPVYQEILASLRDTNGQLAELREQSAEENDKATAIDAMAAEHQRRLLKYGSAVRLARICRVTTEPFVEIGDVMRRGASTQKNKA